VEGKLKAKGINIDKATDTQTEAALKEAQREVEKLSDAEVKTRLEQQAKQLEREERESLTVDEQRVRLALHTTQPKLRSHGTSIADASADEVKTAKQDAVKEVEKLSPEQLKQRLEAAADDEKAEVDEEEEEKFTDDHVVPARANQPGAPAAGDQAPAIGA